MKMSKAAEAYQGDRGEVHPVPMRLKISGAEIDRDTGDVLFEVPTYQFCREEIDTLRDILAPGSDRRVQELIVDEVLEAAQKFHRIEWLRERLSVDW